MRLWLAILAAGVAASCSGGSGDPPEARERLRATGGAEIAGARLDDHLRALERIAERAGGSRATGTPGYEASVAYVLDELREAGYEPSVDRFRYPGYVETAPPTLEVVEPRGAAVVEPADYVTMHYSGRGDVVGPVRPIDLAVPPGPPGSSTSGCAASDFAGLPNDAVALVQRGGCFLSEKARNAVDAGASAVLIMNEGQPGRGEALQGTLLGADAETPVLGVSYRVGTELARLAATRRVRLRVATRTQRGEREAANVVADLPGREDEVVLLGAHLDSVAAGPGINDNGSGVAAVLETARALASVGETPRRTVRFAFWGAEELGLHGSSAYVDDLDEDEREAIVAVLNLDMLGSPNAARFVFDGDGSAEGTAGPEGSARIERLYLAAFRAAGLMTAPTALDGSSDYGPFMEAGIPVGGVFSGADEIKTPAEARAFGGEAGRPYDACYHRSCDRRANVDLGTLARMASATVAVMRALAGA